jgi:hypothetical protein
MKRLIVPLVALLFISAFAQETRPKRESLISGRVVADDGQPMGNAQVMAFGVGKSIITNALQTTNCDVDGNFKVTGLSSGVYSIVALAPGYVSVQDQSRKYRVGESVIIRMVRGGVITGRVTDEFSEPIVGVRVWADRVRDSEGKPDTNVSAMNEMNSSRITDDRGVYRIYGLEAGAYVVGVNVASPIFVGLEQASRELPTYHPSSPRGAAVEINLRGAEEMSGVDIRARGGRGRSISGTVSGETQGEGLINSVVIRLVGGADKHLAGTATLVGARNFSLRGVEDGEYELSAVRFNESMDFSLSTPRRVVVRGADLNGVELKLLKLGSVSGRVVIEAPKAECKTADQFKVEEALIELKRDDKTPSVFPSGLFPTEAGVSLGIATPDKGGGFTAKNLEAGRYRINTDLPDETWYIRAITQVATPKPPRPLDISRDGVTLKQGERLSGIEMVIAQGAASLSGRVVLSSEGAQLPKRLRVHLIPAETTAADDLLRYAEAPVRGDGSFEFNHIAPGKYLLIARQVSEKDANDDLARQLAWDAIERAKLRREAAAAKTEIELKPCQRLKEHILRWRP